MTLFSIQLFVFISLSTSLVSSICFQDSDCAFWRPNTNCVWFHCVSPSCRSDEDCKKWGWTSHFCLNNEATFFGKACTMCVVEGTTCVVKRFSKAICYRDNNCISGKCDWFLGFFGLKSFGVCK